MTHQKELARRVLSQAKSMAILLLKESLSLDMPVHFMTKQHLFHQAPLKKTEFFLKWVSRRITVCQGKCQRPMRDEQGRIYPPPYDLCLARKERRSFRSPLDGMKKLGKGSDCHYHFKRSCVENGDPPYQGERIIIPPEVSVRMTQAHKDILKTEFGQ